ncbi:hypothetical protein ABZT02_36765 [Streptomyces sp. NPDC005402]|uniref:hypothetical protein n=1 Tax=Streptomyces sp. NPDC005402 TaxID=3155338 RepID=UPI0033B4C20D
MREQEWPRSDDGIFMTRQALDTAATCRLTSLHDACAAMIRTALTNHYADLVDIPRFRPRPDRQAGRAR